MNERRTFLPSVAAFFVGLVLGQPANPAAVIRWHRIRPPIVHSEHPDGRFTMTFSGECLVFSNHPGSI